jgi:two-component system cell cycle response regulator DivK
MMDEDADSRDRLTVTDVAERNRPLVLVVEDDPHDWEIYGKILWYNGYDVIHAADGETGWRMALEHEPDLVLLDVMIPKLDGLSLCERLMSDPARARIPVVILTGRPREEVGNRARRAGCSRFLEKPARPLDVLHEVESLIGRPPSPGEGPAPRKYPSAA